VSPESVTVDTLAETLPARKWSRPVCLMVDEIQTVWRESEGGIAPAVSETLLAFHEDGLKLPIVPLYAGLGDSHDTLRAAGLTRLDSDAVHDIGALAAGEAEEAVERMLEEFRVSREGDRVGWPRRVAERSDGWPQHLHNAMRALASELLAARGRLEDVDEYRMWRRERERRTVAYGRRRGSGAILEARRLVAELMRSLPPEGLDKETIQGHILRHGRRFDDPGADADGWRLPEGEDAAWFVRRLVHRGVPQLNAEGLYSCPIPSFRSYLIGKGGQLLERSASGVDSLERERLYRGGDPDNLAFSRC